MGEHIASVMTKEMSSSVLPEKEFKNGVRV
jgi:hypothetical protein